MRLIWIYIDNNAPAVSTVSNVTKIEEVTVDSEPAIKATTSGGSVYTVKKSVAQPVIQWE